MDIAGRVAVIIADVFWEEFIHPLEPAVQFGGASEARKHRRPFLCAGDTNKAQKPSAFPFFLALSWPIMLLFPNTKGH